MKLKKSLQVLVAASMVAALGAACGDDGGTAAADGDGKITCSGQEIRFQLSFFPNAQHVGFLVAQARGFYKDEGVKVETLPGGPTVNPPLQLAQGNVDIAQVDFVDAMAAAGSDAPLTYVGQTYQQDPLRYVSLDGVRLDEPADLKGKTVGEQQAGSSPELQGLLHKAGMTMDDVTVKSIGFSIEDLMNKNVQVFPLQAYFHIAQLRSAGVEYPDGVNVLDPNKHGVAVASQGLAVFDPFLEEQRNAVVCFLRASLRGWQAAIDDPEAALAAVEKYIPEGASKTEDNKVDIEETIKIVTTKADGSKVTELLTMDPAYLKASQKILLDSKALEKETDINEVIDPDPLADARRTLAGK